MRADPGTPEPKSLADILADELDQTVASRGHQDLPTLEKQAQLEAIYARIHAEQPERSALCLSGGGIRSAIFGLGILQGLAKHRLLCAFDYLSTVSGGGYVGGWLTAWIAHHPEGAAGVAEELRRRPDSPLNPEPQPIRHLRAFSNYLTPRTGLTSVDSWTLIATYLRNMLLNWFVLISWLAAAMMVPRLFLAAILLPPARWTESPLYLEHLAEYNVALTCLLALAFVLVAVAMAYAIIDVPSTGDRRWSQNRFLLCRQLPLLVASLALTEWWALYSNIHSSAGFRSGTGLLQFVDFAVATYLAGGILAGLFLRFSRQQKGKSHLGASLFRLGAILATTAFGGLCLWAVATQLFSDPAKSAINYVCFAPPFIFAALLLVNFLFTGLASWVSEDEDREWWARSAAWILITICGWIVVNVVVLWGAQLINTQTTNRLAVFLGDVQANPVAKTLLATFGGVTGLVALILSFRSKISKKLGNNGSGQGVLIAIAILFFVLLSIVISWLLLFIGAQKWTENATTWLLGSNDKYQNQLFVVFLLTAANLLVGMAMGFFINVNKFSLHATYRNRLIRAFLAASRTNEERHPHLFTGFDPEDNINLKDLKTDKPFHVINSALNLVKGSELAWQERRAESFTMSRLHCGSWHLGYRPSAEYGAAVSLGTALTISGAAANPNMGYHSSAIVGFLMTLFNVRLGWWLGNSGIPGRHTWKLSGPRYSVRPLFSEAVGNTNDNYPYINLSDGGHFENLGLYEMVLRRCKLIFVVDAGQDFDYVFEDLGNAIRKIRIDFGIPIDIKVVSPKKAGNTISHCAVGTIIYGAIDDGAAPGRLIYVKPVICGDEPPDVANYAAGHPEFPHEPTTDQWFSESQLESYRLLGMHAIDSICGKDWSDKTLPEFFDQVAADRARA
jgi:hypothetical protein